MLTPCLPGDTNHGELCLFFTKKTAANEKNVTIMISFFSHVEATMCAPPGVVIGSM